MAKKRDINIDEAKRLYYHEGLSYRIVADQLSVSSSTLKGHFKKAGLPSRKQGYRINLEEAKGLYFEEGLSIAAVAARLGVSRSGIRYRFTVAGIIVRERGDAIKLAYKQGRRKLSTGGRRINSSGYIEVIEPQHPRAKGETGYVLEHILVWEKVNNRPLPKGWVIHHLNGIKDDNRPCNLVAMPLSKHSRREAAEAYKRRIRELEAEVALLRRALESNQAIFYVSEN